MMRALSASELLGAWEQGLGQSPSERALTLLAAIDPRNSRDALAKLSIGRRDAGLLSLREEIFGSRLISLADCPACGERLELSFNTADIEDSLPATTLEEFSIKIEDWHVGFRLPNSDDLLALSDCNDEDVGRALLLRRCILSAEKNREAGAIDDLPATVIEGVVERMAEADALGDVEIALNCPLCGHDWQEPFDIVSFLWTEINAWARRALQDVHKLARAYGWREADILALSPLRRQVYLEMISQ
jgi:hypothetical protein